MMLWRKYVSRQRPTTGATACGVASHGQTSRTGCESAMDPASNGAARRVFHLLTCAMIQISNCVLAGAYLWV